MVVDDAPAAVKLLFELLGAAGFRVRPATSGPAALAAVAADPPELILLDLYMPGMDGFEVCRRLKAEAATRDIPVLLLSGIMVDDDRARGFAVGAVDFIAKPFNRDELLARVRTHLELHRLRRDLERQVQAARDRLEGEQAERARLEARLRQSEKLEAIGQLAGGIAHDFNNQLTCVLGFAESLARHPGCQYDPRLSVPVEHIRKAARRAADLTRQLLAFSRKGQLVSVAIDVHALVDEVMALLERSLDRRIVVIRRLAAAAAVVQGDPSQVQNALLNLALNARDAMSEGGELTFTTEVSELDCAAAEALEVEPGRYLRLAVGDTGCGMDAHTRSHLFEPFFTTKPPGKGTGLGLASVYGMVKSHHGAVTVESEPGRGSEFSLHLPLASGSAEVPPPVDAGRRSEPDGRLVQFVDDEEVVRELVLSLLDDLGYRAVCHRDGVEALEWYRGHWQEVALVVLDMNMPRMNGRETFQAMRIINPGVRALLTSGYGAGCEIQGALAEGMRGFLGKPFDRAELAAKVAQALGPP